MHTNRYPSRTLLIGFILLAGACTPELEEEPRCRLTADGWVCEDGGSPPDAGPFADAGSAADTGSEPLDSGPSADTATEDASQQEEMSTPATSCAQLAGRGDTGRGLRTIELAGEMTEVFCEQDLAGGGWMLVGRSVAGATGNFGWNTARGALDNDDEPYSMGRMDIEVSELLIGDRGAGKAWGDRVYRVDLPDQFLSECSASACQTNVTKVVGTCDNPAMFNYAGFVQRTDAFWMRDVAEDVLYGLLPDGWSVFYDDCVGGELNGRQGMIFVR